MLLSMYEAKKTLKALAMEYQKIYACPTRMLLHAQFVENQGGR